MVSAIGINQRIEEIVDKHSLAKHESDYIFDKIKFETVSYSNHYYQIWFRNKRSRRQDW